MPGRHALPAEDGPLAPAPPQPPSGWYTDPADGAQWRWWSGQEWAEHRHPRDPLLADEYAQPGTVKAIEAAAPSLVARPEPEPAPAVYAPSDLRSRIPAQSLMEQILRLSESAKSETRTDSRHHLPDEIHSWYAGAVGERRVAEILSRLGEEWTVLHSVPVGSEGSDIDHVLIGPAGVYTINTKHHANKDVWVAGRALRVSNHPQHHISNAAFEARRAAKLLTQASGLTVETAGMVVVVGARKLVIKAAPDGDDVTVGVVRDSELLGALQSRRIYSDEQVRRIADAAVQAGTWSLLPVSTVDPEELQAQYETLEGELAAEAKKRNSQAAAKRAPTSRPQRASQPQRYAPRRPPSRRPSKKRRSVLLELMKLAVLAVVLIVAMNYLGSLGSSSAPAPASFASAELEQSALSQAAGTAASALDQLSPSGVRPASLVVGDDSTLTAPDGSTVVALPAGTTADYVPSADGLSYTLTLTGPQHGTTVTVTPESGVVPAPAATT